MRELDPRAGTYEIRVNGRLRYELRRPAPRGRIDVVVDRDPDEYTNVTVYVDGVKLTGSRLAIHVVDPGASGPDHDWLESMTEHADSVPEAVRAEIDELAHRYHERHLCDVLRCKAIHAAAPEEAAE
ncbi:hypothetical protein [Streptomyces nigrescens]|uniref:hypothetical protein n=1 Tax=Streptomyces nigrescens TaxID=1920 RepID=UPI0036F4DF9D